MSIISHVSYSSSSDLENIITQNDGSPLYGEIEMFRRIYNDCSNNSYTWHFWHDLRLPVAVKHQREIQIDFLLICEKGVVIVEVKGGKIGIDQGLYYYEISRERTFMERSPFDQAQDYMYALINNKIIGASQLFLDTVCAFPHTRMEHTNANPTADQGYKLWSKLLQDNNSLSFAEFCLNVLEFDKNKKGWLRPDLTPDEVVIAIQTLLFNFENRTRNVYSEKGLEVILQRLNIDNLSTFNSLKKNERIFIEGGPGTGKTTIAKAYIEKYHTLRGLYLCWNRLLAAKIKNELWKAGLPNCRVEQFASYIFSLQIDNTNETISLEEISSGTGIEKLKKTLAGIRNQNDFTPFDYVIIDEGQDVLDKGAVPVLNSMTSITCDGLSSGRYLVFYDTEQGYDSENRRIKEIADIVALNGARFELDVNKRVPNNKEIISFAKLLLEGATPEELFEKIQIEKYDSTKIFFFDSAKQLIKHINAIKMKIKDNALNYSEFVILADSSTKHEQTSGQESLYDRIATIDGIKELTPTNICLNTCEIPFTSILSYKGLESKHVILIINDRVDINVLELYVGMTRAIIDLQLLILRRK